MVSVELAREGADVLEKLINEQELDPRGLAEFCDSVKDYNPIHRDEQAARGLGFQGTPIVGTYFSALVERVGRNIALRQNQTNKNLTLIGQKIKFSSPLYVGRKSRGVIGEAVQNGNAVEIPVQFYDGDVLCVDARCIIGEEREPEAVPGKRMFEKTFEINMDDLADYSSRIGQDIPMIGYTQPTSISTFAHAEALSVAGLLELLDAINAHQKTSHKGMNRSMQSNFFYQLAEGTARVGIYRDRERPLPGGKFYYRFRTAVEQQGETLVTPQIECLTDGMLDLDAFIQANSKP